MTDTKKGNSIIDYSLLLAEDNKSQYGQLTEATVMDNLEALSKIGISSTFEMTNSLLAEFYNNIKKNLIQNQKDEEELNKFIENPTSVAQTELPTNIKLFLSLFRKYLELNGAKIAFSNSKEDEQISNFCLLNFNHETNFKYVVEFTTSGDFTFDNAMAQQNTMNSILNDFHKRLLYNLKKQKNQIKIIEFNKVENREEDTVELTFIFINQTNQEMLDETVDLASLQQYLSEELYPVFNDFRVYKKRVIDTIYFSKTSFLKKYSRDWISLIGYIDYRGIKKGEKIEYWFPTDWYGIGRDISCYGGDQKWLSMEQNEPGAWAVGYLPGKISLVPINKSDKYNNSTDKFTNQKIKQGTIVYRLQKDMEKECDAFEVNGKKYKIGFLCRLNIDTIQCPTDNTKVFIMDNISDIRPYRILFREIQ